MLSALPATYATTRAELHRLAEEVLKPAREEVTGRFGLRALSGGGEFAQIRSVVLAGFATRGG